MKTGLLALDAAERLKKKQKLPTGLANMKVTGNLSNGDLKKSPKDYGIVPKTMCAQVSCIIKNICQH